MAGRYSSSLTTTAVLSAVFVVITNMIAAQPDSMGTQLASACIPGENGGVKLTAEIWSMKYIQSPNYTAPYPDNLSCAWKLQTDPGYVIHLYVISMDLEEGYSNCSKGAITLYDASWESSSAQMDPLCYGRDYFSTGSEMFITFKSDSSYRPNRPNRAKFRLMYEAVLAPERISLLRILALEGPIQAGKIIVIIAAGIVVVGVLALIPFVVVGKRRSAMERSRRVHDTESDEVPLLTAPSMSHLVLREAEQETAGDAPGVEGHQAFINLGNDPQPACRVDQHVTVHTSSTDQHATAHTSSANNPNSRLSQADAQGARSGCDVAAAMAGGNGDPQASELLVVL